MRVALQLLVTGTLALGDVVPDARPPAVSRSYSSPAIENLLTTVAAEIKDVNLRQMWLNTYASTLDTTVAWYDLKSDPPESFVITGDIPAMWLRDSMNQVIHYIPAMGKDPDLEKLILGVIMLQAQYINYWPLGNAFKAPSRSGIDSGSNGWAQNDYVGGKFYAEVANVDTEFSDRVWESKYELDSLVSFLRLATTWYEVGSANKAMLVNAVFIDAVTKAIEVMEYMQKPSSDPDWQMSPGYIFRRTADSPTETCFVGGQGNHAAYTGMVRSGFRPSDDSCTYPFLVPSNMMASVALTKLAAIGADLSLDTALVTRITNLAKAIEDGIEKYGTVTLSSGAKIYAFEVDGFGSHNIMDDANVPSLLSAPDLGYVDLSADSKDAKLKQYRATRSLILSDQNPWFFKNESTKIEGIGGPHTGDNRVWMMAVAMRALTTSDIDEIKAQLQMLITMSGGTGLMHEGVDPSDPRNYSRQWFAWANTVFGQLILRLYNDSKLKGILTDFAYIST